MHIPHDSAEAKARPDTAAQLVLREAKRLHKSVRSGSLSASLPILRRLFETRVLKGYSLPELSRRRDDIRRKHILRMLAVEAGNSSWEDYRHTLAALAPTELQHFDIARQDKGQLNLWFSSWSEAEQYVSAHGGRAVRVGQQAVVFAG